MSKCVWEAPPPERGRPKKDESVASIELTRGSSLNSKRFAHIILTPAWLSVISWDYHQKLPKYLGRGGHTLLRGKDIKGNTKYFVNT